MRIAIIGTGYVGLVTGACFAGHGHQVFCFDIDKRKINALQEGEVSIFETGLKELVNEGKRRKTLIFTSSIKDALEKAELIF